MLATFNVKSLRGQVSRDQQRQTKPLLFELIQREQTGFEHRSMARLFRKMMTLPHIVSKALLLGGLIFGIVLAFLSFVSSALASSPTRTTDQTEESPGIILIGCSHAKKRFEQEGKIRARRVNCAISSA
jgi:hypothetical protein